MDSTESAQAEFVTVFYHGRSMLLYRQVALDMGLHDGQSIPDEATFVNVLRNNASWGIVLCRIRIAQKSAESGG